jgi:hypothetical protein
VYSSTHYKGIGEKNHFPAVFLIDGGKPAGRIAEGNDGSKSANLSRRGSVAGHTVNSPSPGAKRLSPEKLADLGEDGLLAPGHFQVYT